MPAARGALGGEYHGEREARQEIEGGSRRTARCCAGSCCGSCSAARDGVDSIDLLIAGSQTGADRASLEAARAAGIATAGVVPQGWKTERGTEQAVLEALGLQEGSGGYAAADKANVKQCDAVLAFASACPRRLRRREDGALRADGRTYEHVEPVAAGRRRLEALEPASPAAAWFSSCGISVLRTRRAPPPNWSPFSNAWLRKGYGDGARRVDAPAAGEHIGAMLAMAFAQMK